MDRLAAPAIARIFICLAQTDHYAYAHTNKMALATSRTRAASLQRLVVKDLLPDHALSDQWEIRSFVGPVITYEILVHPALGHLRSIELHDPDAIISQDDDRWLNAIRLAAALDRQPCLVEATILVDAVIGFASTSLQRLTVRCYDHRPFALPNLTSLVILNEMQSTIDDTESAHPRLVSLTLPPGWASS